MINVNDDSSTNQSLNNNGEFEMMKERKYDILVTGHPLGAGICLFVRLLRMKTKYLKEICTCLWWYIQ